MVNRMESDSYEHAKESSYGNSTADTLNSQHHFQKEIMLQSRGRMLEEMSFAEIKRNTERITQLELTSEHLRQPIESLDSDINELQCETSNLTLVSGRHTESIDALQADGDLRRRYLVF